MFIFRGDRRCIHDFFAEFRVRRVFETFWASKSQFHRFRQFAKVHAMRHTSDSYGNTYIYDAQYVLE